MTAVLRPLLTSMAFVVLVACEPPKSLSNGGLSASEPAKETPPPEQPPKVEPPPPIAPIEPHAFSVLDMLGFDRISDPRVSPDGSKVAFTVRTTDLEANRGRTDVWVVALDGGIPKRLTDDPGNDDHPRWSKDGRSIYFLSNRAGRAGIWNVAAGGGPSSEVLRLPLDMENLELSSDGAVLVFTANVFVDCEDLACTRRRLDEAEKPRDSARAYDRDFARHWDSWEDGRRSHLFVVPVAGGTPVDVTSGLDADVPSQPFGGSEEFALSPDGKTMVFTAKADAGSEAWSTNFDLFEVPVDGSAPPRNLTEKALAWDTNPVFSPDGKQLAWLAMERPGYEADRFRIMVRDWPEGKPRVLAADWDRSPASMTFSSDGKALLVTADERGETPLFSVALEGGEVTRLAGDGKIAAVAPSERRIIVAREDLDRPAELYSIALDGSDLRPVTQINRERVARARRGQWEHFSFTGAHGDEVWAYLVKPVDLDETKRYPIALLVHGGPQGSFGNAFSYRWNPQAFAGAGYAALMIDFHGSTGYGQAFTDSIRGDWGGKPLEDLKKGLAAAAARYAFLDPTRACALGGSYGGFMVNWIAGLWPEGFRCLVNHDGVFDNRAMYYETEELWFPEWEHGAPHYAKPAGYERHNPVMHVSAWKTPMLVIHGENDFRVPVTQGLAAFNALQRRGIPSRFLHFPDENHWVLRPRNSRRWYEEVLAWLDRHVGTPEKKP